MVQPHLLLVEKLLHQVLLLVVEVQLQLLLVEVAEERFVEEVLAGVDGVEVEVDRIVVQVPILVVVVVHHNDLFIKM
jgi:hypothetical protein